MNYVRSGLPLSGAIKDDAAKSAVHMRTEGAALDDI